jgi:ribosomal protein L24E
MPKCVYCGEMYDIHKGLTLVKSDGSVNHLCSAKCRKNMHMKRRKVRWISKTKKIKGVKEPVPTETKEQIVKDIEGPGKVPEKVAEKEEKIAEKQAEK